MMSAGFGSSFSTSFSSSISSASSSASLYPSDFSQLCTSPHEHSAFLPSLRSLSPGPNFQGSWLDIDSDNEDDAAARRGKPPRLNRKGSGTSLKDAYPRHPLATIRELTRRGSMHLRRLSIKKSQ
ncbi:hypothetical protein H4R19_006465 [Coemansia spiralis]|nr:hypothetical protein H4R19_006465 [Coemansia spiralis]